MSAVSLRNREQTSTFRDVLRRVEEATNPCCLFDSRLSDLATLYDGGGRISENGLPEVEPVTAEAYERRIQKVERENKELARKLQGQNSILCFLARHSFGVGIWHCVHCQDWSKREM